MQSLGNRIPSLGVLLRAEAVDETVSRVDDGLRRAPHLVRRLEWHRLERTRHVGQRLEIAFATVHSGRFGPAGLTGVGEIPMKRPMRRIRTRTLKQLIRRRALWLPASCKFFSAVDLSVFTLGSSPA